MLADLLMNFIIYKKLKIFLIFIQLFLIYILKKTNINSNIYLKKSNINNID